MAEKTKIQWCRYTMNPWIGCAHARMLDDSGKEYVAEGCLNCYAEQLMDRRYHRVEWGANGTRSRTKTWNDPVRWDREAQQAGEKRKVFCASLADVFEDRSELVPWREDLFQLIDRCKNLYWLLLTKRPGNVRRMWSGGKYRQNVWLGCSVAVQRNEHSVRELLELTDLAPVRFVSLEPQVGPVTLVDYLAPDKVNWVISGGESSQVMEGRPWNVNWGRVTKDECREAGIPWFLKQYGSKPFEGNKPVCLRDSHGGDMAEWEPEMRVRECPETYEKDR